MTSTRPRRGWPSSISRPRIPSLWNDTARAQRVMQERNALDDQLTAIGRIERELDDQITMIELGDAEKDQRVIAEAEDALKRLKAEAARRELEALLSGEADANDAYLEVHAGAGGTESQDWADMLMRMYTRWAEQHGYKVEWLEEFEGEGAGIKSATIQVKGHNAYGWLKTENGVHRLVRISPFDSNARRHTSFASVAVLSGGRRPHQDRDQRSRRAHRHDALAGRRRAARQQDRIRGAPDPHPDRHRGGVPAGALAAQEPRSGLGHAARAALRDRIEDGARSRPRPSRRPRPTSAGATRSAPTCCSPIRW